MQRDEADVAVIGGGPAGVAAAYQCRREGIDDVIILEKDSIGGLIRYANRIENIPGFIEDDGRKVVDELKLIVDNANIDHVKVEVKGISCDDRSFILSTDDENVSCEHVVVATGTEPRSLNIPGEIHHPPWSGYDGETVFVIGGGDAAYDYALRIHRLGGDVTILRRNEPKAVASLIEQVRSTDIREITGEIVTYEKKQEGYTINTVDDDYDCDKIVTAIGRDPNLPEIGFDFGKVALPSGKTSVEGLYMIGSLVLDEFRQLPLCWGMGIAAGMEIGKSYRIQTHRLKHK